MQNKILNFATKTKNFLINCFRHIKRISKKAITFISSWWRGIVFVLIVFMFLYYPIGALIINNVDKKTDYNFISLENHLQSNSIDMMSHIVDREVNQKVWTPNLPFFFPSAILDNMPNFQLGMFDAMANFSQAFSSSFEAKSEIVEAAELLSYSGKIWMFSAENKITPISSANRKYREARKKLKNFNLSLAEGKEIFYKRPADLSLILRKSGRDISKSVAILENHIKEENGNFVNLKNDDVFFYNQGKIYAYYLLINSVGQDYKDIIVANNLYPRWTIITKALEDAVKINPMIVKNGNLNSSFTPNHLSYLAFYGLKTDSNIQKIVKRLDKL